MGLVKFESKGLFKDRVSVFQLPLGTGLYLGGYLVNRRDRNSRAAVSAGLVQQLPFRTRRLV